MSLKTEKILTGENVLRAATGRIEWLFDTFSSVCLSLSGGKDSTVLFHLLAEEARRRGRRVPVPAGMGLLGAGCGPGP